MTPLFRYQKHPLLDTHYGTRFAPLHVQVDADDKFGSGVLHILTLESQDKRDLFVDDLVTAVQAIRKIYGDTVSPRLKIGPRRIVELRWYAPQRMTGGAQPTGGDPAAGGQSLIDQLFGDTP